MLTQARLKELFNYNPETGEFARKSTGAVCGSKMTGGYLRMRVDGKAYTCHRLAWLYVYGCFPSKGVDHKNCKKDDNRISNLREATQAENGQNTGSLRSNKHGLPGVTWVGRNKKWKAKIRTKGKSVYLGLFDTAEEASKAYLAKKLEIHPFFNGL